MKPREPRRKILIKARMRQGGTWRDVCMRDISSRGLLLQAPAPPPAGSYIELWRGQNLIMARVVWTGGHRFGVRTQDRMDVEAIIAEPDRSQGGFRQGVAGQAPIERRARHRRDGPAEIAQKAERSRRFARGFDFACRAVFCITMAIALFAIVESTLMGPMEAVAAHMGGE